MLSWSMMAYGGISGMVGSFEEEKRLARWVLWIFLATLVLGIFLIGMFEASASASASASSEGVPVVVWSGSINDVWVNDSCVIEAERAVVDGVVNISADNVVLRNLSVEGGGIYAFGVSGLHISGAKVSNGSSRAILLVGCSDSSVEDCRVENITGWSHGIQLMFCSNVVLRRNIVSGVNVTGIYLEYGNSGCLVASNQVWGCAYGIELLDSCNNLVVGNMVWDNNLNWQTGGGGYGILVQIDSRENLVLSNVAFGHMVSGFSFESRSYHCRLAANHAFNNTVDLNNDAKAIVEKNTFGVVVVDAEDNKDYSLAAGVAKVVVLLCAVLVALYVATKVFNFESKKRRRV